MRFSGIAIALIALAATVSNSLAQAPPPQLPADSMQMSGSRGFVWSQDKTNIVELLGPVVIQLDHTRLVADNAIIWMTPDPHRLLSEQHVEIALLGNAELHQGTIVRTERKLLVTASVTGSIRLVGERSAVDDHGSALYAAGESLRNGSNVTPTAGTPALPFFPERQWSDFPAARPAPQPSSTALPTTRPKQSFDFNNEHWQNMTTSDGHIAVALTDGLTCRYLDEKGNLLEFEARNGILFTDLTSVVGINRGPAQKHLISDHILAGYFEGDVQVYVTPADALKNELRMRAERVYYEFRTDRAVLTDVVLHTVDIKKNIPVFMRAQLVRQLSQGEYITDNVQLTTSSFANPSYSLAASKAYVRAEGTGDPNIGDRVTFSADNALLEAWGLPLFYLPVAGGTMTSRGGPLRGISLSDDSDYGYNIRSQWGLFESLGQPAPKDLDAAYRLDYYGKRGPGGGLDSTYQGGFVSETTRDPWNFTGDLHAYFVDDKGLDDLGGLRFPGTSTGNDDFPGLGQRSVFRGRAYLEHQNFFPDDWQAQVRFGYVSDVNFLTQWFPDEYRNNLPLDESIYLKHQHNSEVFTLLGEWQPNDTITTTEFVAEQKEIERVPEIGYHRVGDSVGDDRLTFFSDNTLAALEFSSNQAPLAQQGLTSLNVRNPSVFTPGIPSFAYTGDPGDTTYRGDFREEIDWPVNAGPIKVIPYVFGRYTVYSQGVDAYPRPVAPVPGLPPFTAPGKTIPDSTIVGADENRVMAGAGLRFTTSFWKVDDTAQSDMFDIHRVRHVIEPEIDLFTSAQTVDQSRLFIYDEGVDAVNDIQAIEIALRQRWQTKRGGPGRWRSVDFFTFDIYANLYANQPDKRFLDPTDFRGLYFPSLPEASIARNSVNADAQWRISDTTAVLADCSENLDRERLATASIGLAVQRDERLSYFIGNRYINDLHSNITTIEAIYELSRSYEISLQESFDFGQSRNVYYSATLTRKFDRFKAGVRVYYDQTTNTNGVSFEFFPFGFGRGLGTDEAQQLAATR